MAGKKSPGEPRDMRGIERMKKCVHSTYWLRKFKNTVNPNKLAKLQNKKVINYIKMIK